jgi:hypothetical protein
MGSGKHEKCVEVTDGSCSVKGRGFLGVGRADREKLEKLEMRVGKLGISAHLRSQAMSRDVTLD